MRQDSRFPLATAILLILSIAGCDDTPSKESLGDEQGATEARLPGESPDEGADLLHEEWATLVSESPADDPIAWSVTDDTWPAAITEPVRWVVTADNFPAPGPPMASNNNVDLEIFEGRIYLGWRTAPTHFASKDTRMEIISSSDGGASWEHEATFALNTDAREPRFHQLNGRLFFTFFEAGTNVIAFEPQAIWRTEFKSTGNWVPLEEESRDGIIVWDVKTRGGELWRTTYRGDHYSSSELGGISVQFERSSDGLNWTPVSGDGEVIFGGVSEVAFEFRSDGSIVAVGRVEDDDERGMGTLVCTAPAEAPGEWTCSDTADPERYDSPELFRFGNRVYMLARRDPQGTFGPEGDFLAYSTRPKTTALYEIDGDSAQIIFIRDIPGVGDTAFPAIRRLSDHRFLFANYTSPLDNPEISWIDAQVSELGTQIYLSEITFNAP